jgi:hypothetical protein
MFCRSCSAEKVTGGGVAEVCPIADEDVPKIKIRQVHTSEDLAEKGTPTLQRVIPEFGLNYFQSDHNADSALRLTPSPARLSSHG